MHALPRTAAAYRIVAAAAITAIAALMAGPSLATTNDGPVIGSFRLDNGMEAVVIEDRRAPVVTHMVWYRVGAADEPPGKSGIAHFLEHLMFKGTDELAPGEFSAIVAANGGQDNAFTSLDYTGYFQRIASDRLDLVMKLEADRMRDLRLDAQSVATERDVVIEERNSRTDNDPQSQFYEQLNAALFQNHPYGIPVIGWRREIEALSLDDALEFYKRFYGPENAILIVAGDVDTATVEALAQKHYGPIAPTGAGPMLRPQEPPHRAARRLTMMDEKVRQPFMVRSYLTPSYVTGDDRETAALALLGDILGDGVTSRLSQRLILGDKLAISAGAYYRGVARDDSSFTVYAVPAEGVALEMVEAAIDEVLAELIAHGPTEAELERVRQVMIANTIFQQDSQSSMARMYGAALTVGLTVEDVLEWPDLLRSVTAADVQAAARDLLDINASVTGYLLGDE